MFNRKLKERIKELERENAELKECFHEYVTVKISNQEEPSYAHVVTRIIQHISEASYNPYLTRLLNFIVSELDILQASILRKDRLCHNK
jgi:hypothetical protein